MKSIQAQNVNHPDHTEPLNEVKYRHIRDAIVTVLGSAGKNGLSFRELEEAVDRYIDDNGVPRDLFPKPGSVRWYTKAVQLDLEARNTIERISDQRPLRFRTIGDPESKTAG